MLSEQRKNIFYTFCMRKNHSFGYKFRFSQNQLVAICVINNYVDMY